MFTKPKQKNAILFTQCLQNDFISKDALGSNAIHIGEVESERLRTNLSNFLNTFKIPEEGVHFVHIRDWHDDTATEARERGELAMFKPHCIKNTEGAKLYGKLEEFVKRYLSLNTVVNSNTLNDVNETTLSNVITSLVRDENRDNINVGIVGVWTNAKVIFLAYELITRFNFTNVAVCPALCAADSKESHEIGLKILHNVLGVRMVDDITEFQKFLGIYAPPGQHSQLAF